MALLNGFREAISTRGLVRLRSRVKSSCRPEHRCPWSRRPSDPRPRDGEVEARDGTGSDGASPPENSTARAVCDADRSRPLGLCRQLLQDLERQGVHLATQLPGHRLESLDQGPGLVEPAAGRKIFEVRRHLAGHRRRTPRAARRACERPRASCGASPASRASATSASRAGAKASKSLHISRRPFLVTVARAPARSGVEQARAVPGYRPGRPGSAGGGATRSMAAKSSAARTGFER